MKTTIILEITHRTKLPDDMTDVVEDRAYQVINARGGFAGDVTARIVELADLPVKEMSDEV